MTDPETQTGASPVTKTGTPPRGVPPAPKSLETGHQVLKPANNWFGPDVYTIAREGRLLLVKDFSRRPWITRQTWGRVCVRRELSAYRRLRGIQGVPAFIELQSPFAFALEFVQGETLPRHQARHGMTPEFFRKLQATVAEMHARGVAHGDIRRRNILQTSDGRGVLIDFETCVVDRWDPIRSAIFRVACRIDRFTLLKIMASYFPESLTSGEQETLSRPPLLLRIGRFLRHGIYANFKPEIHRQRRRARRYRRNAKKVAEKRRRAGLPPLERPGPPA